MSVFLVFAHALSLLASPVPAAPTEAWCDKAPAAPVEVDFDHCSVDGTIIRVSPVSPAV